MSKNKCIKFGVFTDLHTEIINNPELRIESFVDACIEQKVDFAIQLGDFIQPPKPGKYECDDCDVSITMKNILAGKGLSDERKVELLHMFDRLDKHNIPMYHVIGNHDLDLYTKQEMCDFLGMEKPYYSFDCANMHFIVLDLNYGYVDGKEISFSRGNYLKWFFKNDEKCPYLPKEQFDWLRKDLNNTDKKSIILSHEGLNYAFLNAINYREIMFILANAPNGITLCINGHKHQDLFDREFGIPFYSLNSMSGYSVPPQFACSRFDDKTEQEYPNVKYMSVYKDPLFAIVSIDDSYTKIQGVESSFVPPCPSKIGVKFSDPSIVLTPHISSMAFRQETMYDGFKTAINDLLNKVDDMVLITDSDGVLIRYNSAWYKSYSNAKGTYKDPIGRKIWELIPQNKTNSWIRDLFYQDIINTDLDTFVESAALLSKGTAVRMYRDEKIIVVDFQDDTGEILKFRISVSKFIVGGSLSIAFVVTNLTRLINSTTALVRYTSKNIAEYIVKDIEGNKLGGINVDATILMTDLRGYTAMSTNMSASELITVINHYFTEMVAIVNKYDGNIVEFLGDGIFVIFGAPNNDPKHAEKAVACAIEMQTAMERVNNWNKDNGFPELNMGIGINSGEVVVGNMGSKSQMRYGAIGEQVNLAGRIEGCTVAHQILISEATKSRISQPLIIEDSQHIMPKGSTKSIKIYDVVGVQGDYDLNCRIDVKDEKFVAAKKDTQLRIVIDKVISKSSYDCTITELSSSYAIISTDANLVKNDNVKFDFYDGVYAKVHVDCNQHGIKENHNLYIVCFTYKPKKFEGYLNGLI